MELLLTLLLSLCITAIAYLLVPVIFCIRGKRLTHSQIKRIIIINGACVWLVFMIIRINAGGEGTSAAVFLWSAIAYWMLRKKCMTTEQKDDEYSNSTPSQYNTISVSQKLSLSEESKESESNTGWCVKASDLKLETDNLASGFGSHATAHIQNSEESTTYELYSKCDKSEERYSNGISWKTVLNVVMVVLLLASLSFNIYQYTDTNYKSDHNVAETNRDYIDVLEKEKLEFFDEFVVLVEDDGTNLFHKYECDKFLGEGFWAFNVDAAKDEGYSPCPHCHN